MQIIQIDPSSVISEFQREFDSELKVIRRKNKLSYSELPWLEMVPGYRLFETDLGSLLDVYGLLKSSGLDSNVPKEWQVPYQELAVVSSHSLSFLAEIKNREFFIDQLFRKGPSFHDNPYPAMRFQLLVAWHLKNCGNRVMPKFLDNHEDFDIVITTPQGREVEIECKIQSEESGGRIDKNAVKDLTEVLRSEAFRRQRRVQVIIDCDSDIRCSDVSEIKATMDKQFLANQSLSLQQKINGKQFSISVKETGEITEKLSILEAEVLLEPFRKHYHIGVWAKHLPEEQREEGFSFVAMKSGKTNRPLTNLHNSFIHAAKSQFSGIRPAVVVIHLDADVEVEKIVNLDNFKEAFGSAFGRYPKVNALAFSSMDVREPSGVGYPFGRWIVFHNRQVALSTEGLNIPGLTVE